jgi:uncharacterized repeat protein (TIGR03847 family)
MARRIYAFDPPDRFLAGTVGPPGQRTFFLQARQGGLSLSVVVEKAQVAVLADRVAAILGEVARRRGDRPADDLVETTAIGDLGDLVDPTAAPEVLEEPVDEAFRVGTLALAWDGDDERVVIEARAMSETDGDDELELDDDDPDGPDVLRVALEPDAARAFVRNAAVLLASGRPPCPLCGTPLNPEGHICARRNGYVN